MDGQLSGEGEKMQITLNQNHIHHRWRRATLIIQALYERHAAIRRLHNRRWPTVPRFSQEIDFQRSGCLALTWIGESETLALAMSATNDVLKFVRLLLQFAF